MARNAAQSDFVVERTPPPITEAPDDAPFASARATRVVFVAMFVVLIALAVLMIVGLHIPTGE
jgi:hypothetical protein